MFSGIASLFQAERGSRRGRTIGAQDRDGQLTFGQQLNIDQVGNARHHLGGGYAAQTGRRIGGFDLVAARRQGDLGVKEAVGIGADHIVITEGNLHLDIRPRRAAIRGKDVTGQAAVDFPGRRKLNHEVSGVRIKRSRHTAEGQHRGIKRAGDLQAPGTR